MHNKRKILVLGIDGMNPRTTNKLLAEGKMPNFKKYLERGAAREDLMLLGANPTITPPQWTTLATGAYPMTHGITDFWRQSPDDLDEIVYNLDSRLCSAEQLWNVTAESGYKTLVFHWPGSSWPPSSDNENLMVIDGTSPGSVGNGTCQVDGEFLLAASTENTILKFKAGMEASENVPCVIDAKDVVDSDYEGTAGDKAAAGGKSLKNIILNEADGMHGATANPFYSLLYSPIVEAKNWASCPEGAKEFTILFFKGLVHRPALVLKNEKGIYDKVAIYKSKKDTDPLVILHNGKFESNIIDEQMKGDVLLRVSRNMRILEMNDDGNIVKMWISAGVDIDNDTVFHPKRLHTLLNEQVAPLPPTCTIGCSIEAIHTDCQTANWEYTGQWQAQAINTIIDIENVDVVFSHFHNVDLQEHTFIKYMGRGSNLLSADKYEKFNEDVYTVTDNYLGRFLYRLDEGWTIFIVSDHGLVSPIYRPHMLGDNLGVSVRVMEELGLTAVKKDTTGQDLPEIDWEHTKAVATRSCHIYINLKGRNKYGIVEPKDKYDVEEEVMTALYGYRDKQTGKRIVALALRNREAVLLGLGGPECGDIIYFSAEGYNYDHGDGLSTSLGLEGTSLSPIFVAAGNGIKPAFKTTRVIRQVDVAPTIATLLDIRMPNDCEGAPIYQILL